MKPSAVLAQLARLSGQCMIMREADRVAHTAQLVGLVRRAIAANVTAPEQALLGESGSKPWERREAVQIVGSVALIPVIGKICAGLDPVMAWYLDCCRIEAMQAGIAQVAARHDIETVIFYHNTPGGYINGVPETLELIRQLSAQKLTIAFGDVEDCSAGFWLSVGCTRVVYTPSATVANVGAAIVFQDYSRMFEEAGVTVKVFRSGKYKGAGAMGAPLTPDQEQFMQGRVDELGAAFVADVLRGRPGVSKDDLQGQWFSGAQAVEKKLADATVLNLAALLSELNAAAPV